MALSIYAPKTWNSLPADLRLAPSLCSFKTKLKTFHIFLTEHTLCVHYVCLFVCIYVYLCINVSVFKHFSSLFSFVFFYVKHFER